MVPDSMDIVVFIRKQVNKTYFPINKIAVDRKKGF